MGLIMEPGKLTDNVNRNDSSGEPTRSKVERYGSVTDEAVVVKKLL